MAVEVALADLSLFVHQRAIVELLDLYARAEMGGGKPLSTDVRESLPGRLLANPACRVWLAWDGEIAVGICVAFFGFSTFQAKPLLNLHDIAVRPGVRGGGIGKLLIEAAAAYAREAGCCKLTLEVREDNEYAKKCYAACGFQPGAPLQQFWSRPLPSA